MSKADKEIERRTKTALTAIKQALSERESEVAMFASHHISELDAEYWKERAGTAKPTAKQVIDLLELQSHWGDDGEEGIDTFDFTLPGEVTDYLISVRFDEEGEVESVSMES